MCIRPSTTIISIAKLSVLKDMHQSHYFNFQLSYLFNLTERKENIWISRMRIDLLKFFSFFPDPRPVQPFIDGGSPPQVPERPSGYERSSRDSLCAKDLGSLVSEKFDSVIQ